MLTSLNLKYYDVIYFVQRYSLVLNYVLNISYERYHISYLISLSHISYDLSLDLDTSNEISLMKPSKLFIENDKQFWMNYCLVIPHPTI